MNSDNVTLQYQEQELAIDPPRLIPSMKSFKLVDIPKYEEIDLIESTKQRELTDKGDPR